MAKSKEIKNVYYQETSLEKFRHIRYSIRLFESSCFGVPSRTVRRSDDDAGTSSGWLHKVLHRNDWFGVSLGTAGNNGGGVGALDISSGWLVSSCFGASSGASRWCWCRCIRCFTGWLVSSCFGVSSGTAGGVFGVSLGAALVLIYIYIYILC